MKIKLILIILLIGASSCIAQDTTFYFGGYNNAWFYGHVSDAFLDSLRDTLGFNLMMAGATQSSHFARIGSRFKFIPDMAYAPNNAWNDYNNSNYLKIEAEDQTHIIGFTRGESSDTNGFVYGPISSSGTAYGFLKNLWFATDVNENTKPFTMSIRIKADTINLVRGENIGFVRIRHGDFPYAGARYDTTNNVDADTTRISSTAFFDSPVSTISFVISDITEFSNIQIGTYQKCSFGIDHVVISNRQGREMVEDTLYVSDIVSYAASCPNTENVICWYLRDEPRPTHWLPFKILQDSLAIRGLKPGNAAFNTWVDQSYRDFNSIVNPPFLWTDPYPLLGGQTTTRNCYLNGSIDTTFIGRQVLTRYTGADGPTEYWSQQPPDPQGFQYDLERIFVREFDSVYVVAKEASKDIWYFPQAFEGRHQGISVDTTVSGYDSVVTTYDSNWIWREPTRSEFSCLTYMGMCYGLRGITYFMLDSYINSKDAMIGIWAIDSTGYEFPSPMWYEIQERLRPIIKAISSIYARLISQRAYSLRGDSLTPPGGSFISSISASSTAPNPDRGWFHIGEFTKSGTTDKYVMIVNRACSQDDQGTEAPPVTAVVRFNTSNLYLGNIVYVIDLAKSQRHASGDTGWVAIPDTTYSVRMSDGTLPFTTFLRAGEGRLYKIAAAINPQPFEGTLFADTIHQSPGFTYQGRYSLPGDITIPSGRTLKVKSPARFEAIRCDSQHAGVDTQRVEIKILGKLLAVGSLTDSIKFVSDTSYDCNIGLSHNPIPGNWYGIRDLSNEADTLSYCKIQYAYNSFTASTYSNALLRHCEISHNENSGVYLAATSSNMTTIDTCLIKDNVTGIDSRTSLFTARGNTITNHSKYGIYVLYHPNQSGLQQSIIGNQITRGSGSAAYGVYMGGGLSGFLPAAVFTNNTIKGFGNSGVYLSRTAQGSWVGSSGGVQFTEGNVIDSNGTYGLYCYYSSPAIFSSSACAPGANSFSENGSYGIYCTNSSSPKIMNTWQKNNRMSNIKCASTSYPNLGDSVLFWGNNWFVTYSGPSMTFDIYNSNGNSNTIKAKGNYWGEVPPDLGDFYPSSNYVIYKPYLDTDPCRVGQGRLASGNDNIPEKFALHQNFPNPFNPTTTIAFDLPDPSYVNLSIFNILGQRIRVLADAYYLAGTHSILWDGHNDSGDDVTSGVYFYAINTESHKDIKKMLVLK